MASVSEDYQCMESSNNSIEECLHQFEKIFSQAGWIVKGAGSRIRFAMYKDFRAVLAFNSPGKLGVEYIVSRCNPTPKDWIRAQTTVPKSQEDYSQIMAQVAQDPALYLLQEQEKACANGEPEPDPYALKKLEKEADEAA